MDRGDRDYQAKVAETKKVSDLLQGAIDMHYHGYPEIAKIKNVFKLNQIKKFN